MAQANPQTSLSDAIGDTGSIRTQSFHSGKSVSMPYRCSFPLAGLQLLLVALASQADEVFSFAAVKQMANQMASVAHQPPRRVAAPFLKLDYDKYRLIAPRHDTALWRDAHLPFWAEFFLAGFIYEYPVEINVVDKAGKVTTLGAGPQWFQFRGEAEPLAKTAGGGFSGFRLLTQSGGDREKTEFLVFQGASYFRGRGAEQVYGASARGLAIDVGLPSPEEFPRFVKFWIEQPAENATTARVWALMDSPAVAGAYQFTIAPGKELNVDVEAAVWFRHGVQKVGVAPLTSMWTWDAANAPRNEHRPEVHDSDGLLIFANTNEWTWRSLRRPKTPQVSKWPVEELHGFGLLQRDRNPDHYRDNEAKYHQRPSLWVSPSDDWGPGRVELLELPSEGEGMDNIGAYWVGNEPATAHSHRTLRYRISFGDGPAGRRPEWQVADTRVVSNEDLVTYEIDFVSPSAGTASGDLMPDISSDAGAVGKIEPLIASDGRLKLSFVFHPPADGAARLQAQLGNQSQSVSEKWSYSWTRN
jgi:glucans biosynthesis protein